MQADPQQQQLRVPEGRQEGHSASRYIRERAEGRRGKEKRYKGGTGERGLSRVSAYRAGNAPEYDGAGRQLYGAAPAAAEATYHEESEWWPTSTTLTFFYTTDYTASIRLKAKSTQHGAADPAAKRHTAPGQPL